MINSILTQYDEEEVMKMISKESYEDGVEYGMQVGEERGMKIGEERGVKIGEERGVRIGEKLGETRFKTLVQKLTEADRLEDLKRALSDVNFCNEMYAEFKL